jgi:hypothetical protein
VLQETKGIKLGALDKVDPSTLQRKVTSEIEKR